MRKRIGAGAAAVHAAGRRDETERCEGEGGEGVRELIKADRAISKRDRKEVTGKGSAH